MSDFWCAFNSCSGSEVDVTGISEFSVNERTYHVVDDSIILHRDVEKYNQDSDKSLSEYDSPIADALEQDDR